MILDEYLNLITSEFRKQPDYIATLTATLSVSVRIQEILQSLIPYFDLDVAAGSQLDIIGQWVGVSRNVLVPIPGVYFSWDADYTLGWEYGVWQDPNAFGDVTVLPDDVYRTLIRTKIAANKWDGTTEGAYIVWDEIFPTIKILIQDHQNMSYALILYGGIIDSLTLALLTGGYIPLKPEGIRITDYYVPVNSGKIFGWDVDSDYISGWDDGSWTREITPT